MTAVWDEIANIRAALRLAVLQVLAETPRGGAGSGNFGHPGRPGQVGGSAPGGGGGVVSSHVQNVQLSRHAFLRMKERKKFQSVHQALQQLRQVAVPDNDWHMAVKRGAKVDCYLAGNDGVVKTVLGGWYNPAKLTGVAVGG